MLNSRHDRKSFDGWRIGRSGRWNHGEDEEEDGGGVRPSFVPGFVRVRDRQRRGPCSCSRGTKVRSFVSLSSSFIWVKLPVLFSLFC